MTTENHSLRGRIMRTIAAEGPQTLQELATATPGTSRKQIIDNARHCMKEGLLDRNSSDGTYKITPAGRKWLEGDQKTLPKQKAMRTQAGSGDVTPAGAHRKPAVGGSGDAGPPSGGAPVSCEQPASEAPTDKACCNAARVVASTAGEEVRKLRDQIEKQAQALNEHIAIADDLRRQLMIVTDARDIALRQLNAWREMAGMYGHDTPLDLAGYIGELKNPLENGQKPASTVECQAPALAEQYPHYFRDVRHLSHIDIYRTLDLFEVTEPCAAHAIKKLMCAGRRGAKDALVDYLEAAATICRRMEMLKEDAQEKAHAEQ